MCGIGNERKKAYDKIQLVEVEEATQLLEGGILALAEWHQQKHARTLVEGLIKQEGSPLRCLCLEVPNKKYSVYRLERTLADKCEENRYEKERATQPCDEDEIEGAIKDGFEGLGGEAEPDLKALAVDALAHGIRVLPCEDPKEFMEGAGGFAARDAATFGFLKSKDALSKGTLLLWGADHFCKTNSEERTTLYERVHEELNEEGDPTLELRRAGPLYQAQVDSPSGSEVA